jgi:hypothetical protein
MIRGEKPTTASSLGIVADAVEEVANIAANYSLRRYSRRFLLRH